MICTYVCVMRVCEYVLYVSRVCMYVLYLCMVRSVCAYARTV